MNTTMLMILSAACVMLVLCQLVQGQPLQMSPSFHQISYRVGPDGRSRMGGHGDELEPFFRGLGRTGRRFRGAIAGMQGFRQRFAPMFFGR